mmetsp:Transcript_60053/g.170764  ORF Transcript_60053/g.170764 Transcript_60053/m.170764 type:complete len:254 (-) Transcript_60053:30-791(-)
MCADGAKRCHGKSFVAPAIRDRQCNEVECQNLDQREELLRQRECVLHIKRLKKLRECVEPEDRQEDRDKRVQHLHSELCQEPTTVGHPHNQRDHDDRRDQANGHGVRTLAVVVVVPVAVPVTLRDPMPVSMAMFVRLAGAAALLVASLRIMTFASVGAAVLFPHRGIAVPVAVAAVGLRVVALLHVAVAVVRAVVALLVAVRVRRQQAQRRAPGPEPRPRTRDFGRQARGRGREGHEQTPGHCHHQRRMASQG